MKYFKSIIKIFAIALLVASFVSSYALAYTDNVQSYSSTQPLDKGVIVQMADKSKDSVEPVTAKNAQNMFGVIVDPQQLPIQISKPDVKNEVYVAVSGTQNVLVSTQNGAIMAGDYITPSSINGIGMKADTEQSTVLGRAVSGFDGKGAAVGSMVIKDTAGQAKGTAKIGVVPVTIEIKHNPNIKSTKTKAPEILQRLGQAIAEKEVSALRIYLSVAITAVSLFIALLVVYSGIKNSIISIGRNPMSKKSIFRALLEIILTSILILIIGLFTVYLLLKL